MQNFGSFRVINGSLYLYSIPLLRVILLKTCVSFQAIRFWLLQKHTFFIRDMLYKNLNYWSLKGHIVFFLNKRQEGYIFEAEKEYWYWEEQFHNWSNVFFPKHKFWVNFFLYYFWCRHVLRFIPCCLSWSVSDSVFLLLFLFSFKMCPVGSLNINKCLMLNFYLTWYLSHVPRPVD